MHCILNKGNAFLHLSQTDWLLLNVIAIHLHGTISHLNLPADIASAIEAAKIQFWLKGPEFLFDPDSSNKWKKTVALNILPTEFLPIHKEENFASQKITPVIVFDRLSSLYRLQRVIFQVLQYKTILLCSVHKQRVSYTENLTADKLQNAEMAIICYLQQEHFSALFPASNHKEQRKTLPHFLQNFLPKFCNGVL